MAGGGLLQARAGSGTESRAARRGDILPFTAPTWYPKTQLGNTLILATCTIVTAATQGYDGAMMGGMNILPQFADYFAVSTTTSSLLTATYYVGGCLSCFCWGWVTDQYGRRASLFWAAAITVVASVLQACAQNTAVFCVARIGVGFGTAASSISGPAYLAETMAWHQRVWGLALFDDLYYVGALVAAGLTYRTFRMTGTWSWRIPSLVQGIWGLWCIALLPYMPESPRWLMDQGRPEEALRVLAGVNADGDVHDDMVRLQFCQICDTITYERDPMRPKDMWRQAGPRKRLIIAATCAFFSMLTGNIILTYHVGKMLDRAGVSELDIQLLVNVGLNGTSLVFSIVGSFIVAHRGVKITALISTAGLAVGMVVLGLLTRTYGDAAKAATKRDDDDLVHVVGIRGTVACIFLLAAFYSLGWIPILFLVPAEVLNFSIRAYGMSMFSLVVCGTGIWANFALPWALDRLGWRLFVLHGAWNLAFLLFIAWYWVEVKDKTLEEVDALFDGTTHYDAGVPRVGDVVSGQAALGWRERIAAWMRWKGFTGPSFVPAVRGGG